MGSKEDLLALFTGFGKPKVEPKPLSKERLSKEHEEMMRLLKSEEALSRELIKKSL